MSRVSSRMSQQNKSPKIVGPTLQVSEPKGSAMASQHKGATIFGLMTSKRLARQFASKIRAKRRLPSENASTATQQVQLEPTYRMTPDRKFEKEHVQRMMAAVVETHMKGFVYTPKVAAMITKVMSSEIESAVRSLDYPRYKIVCLVTIGQNLHQDLSVSSRCMWDTNVDTSASYNWNDERSFCSAMVYGIYHI